MVGEDLAKAEIINIHITEFALLSAGNFNVQTNSPQLRAICGIIIALMINLLTLYKIKQAISIDLYDENTYVRLHYFHLLKLL